MSIEAIKNRLPDYAKDIKLNLSAIGNEETLTKQQFWGCALASAFAARNSYVISEIAEEAAHNLDPAAQQAAKAAAAIMAMNNVYYKFTGMITNPDYKTMPAKLRMNILADPGVDKKDFELWSVAVSAINGCKFCVDSHEAKLLKEGMTKEQVQAAVRIAAIIHAAACVLDGEEALQINLTRAA